MNAKTILRSMFAGLLLLTPVFSAAQHNFEITGYGGGQINGGIDFSTTRFSRLEVQNGANYGVMAGYLLGEHYGAEFQWNQNKANAVGQTNTGAPSLKLFNLTQNQYMGNFLIHLKPREAKLRPFFFFGLGANSLTTDVHLVQGATKFSWALGGGAKYNIGEHFGLRTQIRYAPTYITSTNTGYWCDPIWGGCWTSTDNHYLNAVDFTGGITIRF